MGTNTFVIFTVHLTLQLIKQKHTCDLISCFDFVLNRCRGICLKYLCQTLLISEM